MLNDFKTVGADPRVCPSMWMVINIVFHVCLKGGHAIPKGGHAGPPLRW